MSGWTARVLVLALVAFGCGDKKKKAKKKAGPAKPIATIADAAPKTATPPPAMARLKPDTIVNRIPTGATFGLASLERIPASYWERVAYDVRPVFAGLARIAPKRSDRDSPIGNRLLYALAHRLDGKLSAAALGMPTDPALAYYGVGRAVALRVELTRPAVTLALVTRVVEDSQVRSIQRNAGAAKYWRLDNGSQGWLIAVADQTLVLARGPLADIDTHAAALVAGTHQGRAAQLAAIAAKHSWKKQAVGFLDLGALSSNAPSACRAALAPILAAFPSVVMGARAIDPRQTRLEARVAIADPTLLEAIGRAPKGAVGVTPKLPGKPAFAFGFAGLGAFEPRMDKGWLAKLRNAAMACDPDSTPDPETPELPAPWDQLRAGVAVIYDAEWSGLLPSALVGYAMISAAKPERIKRQLDQIPAGTLAAPSAARVDGQRVTLSGGALGARHLRAASKTPLDAGVALLLQMDLGRLLRAGRRSSTPSYEPLDEAGSSEALGRLFGSVGMTMMLHRDALGVHTWFEIAPKSPTPMMVRTLDPKNAKGRVCRTILSRAWAAVRSSAEMLGIEDLAATGRRYKTGLGSGRFIDKCAALTDAELQCLRKAANPVAAVESCGINKARKFLERVNVPRVVPSFHRDDFEHRLHPKLDRKRSRALLRRAAGTWTRKDRFGDTETWRIRGNGALVMKEVSDQRSETRKAKLMLLRAGKARIVDADGSGWEETGFLLTKRRLYTGSPAPRPLADRERFVLDLGSNGYLVYVNGTCTAVGINGLTAPLTCAFETEAGRERLRVSGKLRCRRDLREVCKLDTVFTIVSGHFVHASVYANAMKRR